MPPLPPRQIRLRHKQWAELHPSQDLKHYNQVRALFITQLNERTAKVWNDEIRRLRVRVLGFEYLYWYAEEAPIKDHIYHEWNGQRYVYYFVRRRTIKEVWNDKFKTEPGDDGYGVPPLPTKERDWYWEQHPDLVNQQKEIARLQVQFVTGVHEPAEPKEERTRQDDQPARLSGWTGTPDWVRWMISRRKRGV